MLDSRLTTRFDSRDLDKARELGLDVSAILRTALHDAVSVAQAYRDAVAQTELGASADVALDPEIGCGLL